MHGASNSHIKWAGSFWHTSRSSRSLGGMQCGYGVSLVLLTPICLYCSIGMERFPPNIMLIPLILECLHYSPPFIQHSPDNVKIFIYATLAMCFISYARFCTLVINDITNYLGIACFTVRKKDESGKWRKASSVDKSG